jgi:hypothetical protein
MAPQARAASGRATRDAGLRAFSGMANDAHVQRRDLGTSFHSETKYQNDLLILPPILPLIERLSYLISVLAWDIRAGIHRQRRS